LDEWCNFWFSDQKLESADFSDNSYDDELWELALCELEKNMNSTLSVF